MKTALICALAIGVTCSPTLAPALSLCAMTDEQAAKSSQCLRYYFVCRFQPAPGAGVPGLDQGTVARMVASAIFLAAEKNCENFSYAEAAAALQARIMAAPPPR